VSGEPPPWAVKWLRQKFLSDIQPAGGGLRLYICRSGAQRRRVVNEAEVVAYLQTLGFQCLQAERLSLHEQIRLFADAKVIVAPHGAGLTNMLFAREAVIVEIINPAYFNLCYYRLANVLGHTYWYLLGVPVVPDSPLRWEGEQDMAVPLDALSETLRKALNEV
jgi:capsular polysaccharide biosynthesis protein